MTLTLTHLETLNDKIKAAELAILELQQNVEKIEKQKISIELEIKNAINDEKNEDGKKKYPNEIARKIALDEHLNKNTGHTDLTNTANTLREDIKKAMIELDFLKRKFRIHEIISRSGE